MTALLASNGHAVFAQDGYPGGSSGSPPASGPPPPNGYPGSGYPGNTVDPPPQPGTNSPPTNGYPAASAGFWTMTSTSNGSGSRTQSNPYGGSTTDILSGGSWPNNGDNYPDFGDAGIGGFDLTASLPGSFAFQANGTVTVTLQWHSSTDTNAVGARYPGPGGETEPTTIHLIETGDARWNGSAGLNGSASNGLGNAYTVDVQPQPFWNYFSAATYLGHSTGRRAITIDTTLPVQPDPANPSQNGGIGVDVNDSRITITGALAVAVATTTSIPDDGTAVHVTWGFNVAFDDRTLSLRRDHAHDERTDEYGTVHGDTLYSFLFDCVGAYSTPGWLLNPDWQTFRPTYGGEWSTKKDSGALDVSSTWLHDAGADLSGLEQATAPTDVTSQGNSDVGNWAMSAGSVRYDEVTSSYGGPFPYVVHLDPGQIYPVTDQPQTGRMTYSAIDNQDGRIMVPQYVLTAHDPIEFGPGTSHNKVSCESLLLNPTTNLPIVIDGPSTGVQVTQGNEHSTGWSAGLNTNGVDTGVLKWLGFSGGWQVADNGTVGVASTCGPVDKDCKAYVYVVDKYTRYIALWRQFDAGGENKNYDAQGRQIYYYTWGDTFAESGQPQFYHEVPKESDPLPIAGYFDNTGHPPAFDVNTINDVLVPQPSTP